nr:rRNA (cytidine1402-2-O)-methyltransferase [Candidatus Cloacimonadota bacterium]
MRKGVIYLIPVPIGNLGDITLRALDTLRQLSLIACEDTRKTLFLLSHYNIPAPKLISFHKFNERSREKMLFAHLNTGEDLGIVSDAGSPAISDPAQAIVHTAIQAGYKVEALPGATALIPAISISGFDNSSFQFLGFLPAKDKDRRKLIESLRTYPHPSIIYESVHHLRATLAELAKALAPRQIAIAREISKLHEECIRGEISELAASEDIVLKGEFVIVIDRAEPETLSFPDAEAYQLIKQQNELSSKELATKIADRYGISKKQAYTFVIENK